MKAIPSLVRERVIVQPLVGEHTAKDDKTEGCIGLNLIPVHDHVRLAKKFCSEADLLSMLWSQTGRAKVHRKPDDVPQSQEDG